MFQFEWTINVGNIVAIALLLGGGFKAYLASYRRSIITDAAIERITKTLESLSGVLTTLASQHTDINNMKEDIREIKHGHGFVHLPGEWPPP